MKKASFILTLGTALLVGACSPAPRDSVIPADIATAPDEASTPVASAPAESRATTPRDTRPGANAPAASPPATAPLPDSARARNDAATPVAAATPARERRTTATFREMTLPVGTTLSLRLTSPVASDSSHVEDSVSAEFASPLVVDGLQVIPAGARADGFVAAVGESARVKGRAQLTLEFTSIRLDNSRYDMRTEPVSWLAPATKGEDAVKIGIGAGAGAAIGGLLGGKSGAARGAAVGGAAGTGVVLATRGEEVRLPAGTDVTTRLSAPLTVRLNLND
jgi:hypothetical protein